MRRHADVLETRYALASSMNSLSKSAGFSSAAVAPPRWCSPARATSFGVDCSVTPASGQQVVRAIAFAGWTRVDAFSGVLDKIEKRVRRYKRKLKNHRPATKSVESETAPLTILRASDEDEAEDVSDSDASSQADEPSAAMVVAETEQELRTMTVGMAVLELDLTNYPVILFRNAAHGGLSVVYRRPDGNIGWIDPERATSESHRRSVA